jgi:hypothetical protein
MCLQYAGRTEEQSAANHYSTCVRVWKLIIKLQILSSTKYFQSARVPAGRAMNTLQSQIPERCTYTL